MKYEKLNETIEGAFCGLTMEEQLEFINTSHILKSIYDFGQSEALRNLGKELTERFSSAKRCDSCKCRLNPHPWCMNGIPCDEFELDVKRFIFSLKP